MCRFYEITKLVGSRGLAGKSYRESSSLGVIPRNERFSRLAQLGFSLWVDGGDVAGDSTINYARTEKCVLTKLHITIHPMEEQCVCPTSQNLPKQTQLPIQSVVRWSNKIIAPEHKLRNEKQNDFQ